MDIASLVTVLNGGEKLPQSSEISYGEEAKSYGEEGKPPTDCGSPLSSRSRENSVSSMVCSSDSNTNKDFIPQPEYEQGQGVHEKKPFFCERCLTGFSTKGNLNVHLKTVHFRAYDFRCKDCDRQFSTKASLIRHVRMVHVRERPFNCRFCNQKFATKACVKRHFMRRHRNTQSSDRVHKDAYLANRVP
ncbi:hypothetical protein NDN08_000593 [Rhodosorus marinus]|uniref:C2H2-type domain-containing protein n=1 Tax=Rhodosorus marinus TaxID=101924 RepID=A0AAV8UNM0_9RHOD|nr:hypothetical protein NDN08_000593 [Rhodosorus marinus]